MAKEEKSKTDAEEAKAGILERVWKGQLLPFHFFKRHLIPTLAVTGMLIMSIANKYSCQVKITEIKQLERKLQVEQANRIGASATYNSITRESSMKQLIDTMKIDLMSPERPPYNLNEYE